MTRLTRAENKTLKKLPDLITQLEGGYSYDVTVNYWGSTCWRYNHSKTYRLQIGQKPNHSSEPQLTSRFYLSCATGLKRMSHFMFSKKIKQCLESICNSKSHHSKSNFAPISPVSTSILEPSVFKKSEQDLLYAQTNEYDLNEITSHLFKDPSYNPTVSLLSPPPSGESGAQPSIKTDSGKVNVRDQKGKTNTPLRSREDRRSLSSKLNRIDFVKLKDERDARNIEQSASRRGRFVAPLTEQPI